MSDINTCNIDEYKNIMIVAQSYGQTVDKVTLELVGAAQKLIHSKEEINIVLVTDHAEPLINQLQGYGIDNVYVYENETYKDFSAYQYSFPVVDSIEKHKPRVVLIGATVEGRSLAPIIAVKARTGLTADCTGLSNDKEGNLIQTRPAQGGDIMANILNTNHRPQMSTVRKGIMKAAMPVKNSVTNVVYEIFKPPFTDYLRVVSTKHDDSKEIGIDSADIVIAIGRGIENRGILDKLLEYENHSGIVIGCSRGIVERGWLPISRQIGLSGQAVSPKLLIALGVSGSVQFMAGIAGAEHIVAVNTDPDAPIFRAGDQNYISDAEHVIEMLVSK